MLAAWKDRAPEKIRSNAVHGLEYFIGGSPERMKSMSREEQDAYFEDALGWLKERHGEENILSAVVHRDETTPHMTVMTIPLDERGKLNARSFVGNKKMLSELQSEFAEKVSEPHGLKRGIKGSVARHERVQRVYGAYTSEKDAVQLPERARGRILGAGKESDAEWRVRASEAATASVKALMLEMLDRERASDTKLDLANEMIERLEELVQITSADLEATRELLRETQANATKLVQSIDLAGLGPKMNAALKAEDRILKGDLTLLKETVGSQLRTDQIVYIFNRVLPPETSLTEDQQRFRNAVASTIEGMDNGTIPVRREAQAVALEARPLPHIRKAIEHMLQDRIKPPFETDGEGTAFRVEVEGSLTADQLDALREGNANVLDEILGGSMEEQERLALAVAYYQRADVVVPHEVLDAVVARLTDLEFEHRHSSGPETDKEGITHG